ncbi:MAG: hypothetical protein DRO94_03775 [Candidatus Altiarchaeales archaeon]|nr:MAG: hypothetical protein DRO95_03830 [Candidatus Altiarchaeales archaeon]RLI94051.1 MAG: hypothetical protein DRO94_03775 [Candidatus Altiarchaeales archaeon]HDO82843.1 DUF4013 domain-containing protein [Candidatus Altiarchaeales archaeon]HEX55492.1 DUF4013 domain-containing protein [Candidatus Altiarchaeales archaeon]
MDMVDFSNAIKRPFTDVKKLCIGTLLELIPIVNFIVTGYQLRCAKSAMNKDFKLPEWENWTDLFVKGLTAIIIGFIYSMPIILILVLSMGGAMMSFIGLSGREAAAGGFLSLGIGTFLGLLILILTIYVIPLAVLAYIEKDSFYEAFDFDKIARKARKKDYFVAWIVMLVYSFVISAVLSIVPIVGLAIASFASGVSMMTALGEIYPDL